MAICDDNETAWLGLAWLSATLFNFLFLHMKLIIAVLALGIARPDECVCFFLSFFLFRVSLLFRKRTLNHNSDERRTMHKLKTFEKTNK